MINYFINKQRPWLEEQLAFAQEELAAGRVVIRVAAADTESGEHVEVNTKQRIEMLLYALHAIAPDAYPATSVKRVSRTRLRIYSSES